MCRSPRSPNRETHHRRWQRARRAAWITRDNSGARLLLLGPDRRRRSGAWMPHRHNTYHAKAGAPAAERHCDRGGHRLGPGPGPIRGRRHRAAVPAIAARSARMRRPRTQVGWSGHVAVQGGRWRFQTGRGLNGRMAGRPGSRFVLARGGQRLCCSACGAGLVHAAVILADEQPSTLSRSMMCSAGPRRDQPVLLRQPQRAPPRAAGAPGAPRVPGAAVEVRVPHHLPGVSAGSCPSSASRWTPIRGV